jgi:alanyl-tRNA synthetase
VGYEACQSESVVRRWRQTDGGVDIILDKTPFYAESGGQIGDSGKLLGDDVSIEVSDTIYEGEEIVHRGKLLKGQIGPDRLRAQVHPDRRKATARHHTATHLLQSALRQILGTHVHQSGSSVNPDRLRFDFTHYTAMTPAELDQTEALVNLKIRENLPVTTFHTTLEDARSKGVMALFGEKYDQQVRVVQVAGTSQELCGGTHVESTGEIGLFQIISEGGIAAGVRRIEALAGEAAYLDVHRQRETIRDLSSQLTVGADQLADRVERLLEANRELEKKLKDATARTAVTRLDDILGQAREVMGHQVVAARVEVADRDALLQLADSLREKLPGGVGVLGAVVEDRALLVAVVGEKAQKGNHLRAGDIVREVAQLLGGKGGGKQHLAQGGGGDPEKLSQALAAVPDIIDRKLSTD